jgi:signal peptidase II
MTTMVTDRSTRLTTIMAPAVGTRPLGIASLVLIADQLTKSLVRADLTPCLAPPLAHCDVVHVGAASLVRVGNGGSAFGFAQGLGVWAIVAVLGLILIPLYARICRSGPLLTLAIGLQVGGVVGNLLDRIVLHQVTDFIYLGRGVVFNLADVALLSGTVIATLQVYRAMSFRSTLVGTERG